MVARARAVGIDQVVRVANQEWHEFDVGIDCVPMLDAQESAFERASNAVAGYLRRGKRVLVTCQAGINRSALVAGLAMVKAYGYTGEHALREVQANRRSADHLALCNPAFAEYLRASTAPGALGPLLRFLALVAA
jgi:protein-tyrosine phosphatase